MAIPTDLTHAEVGAYLIAIGTHMVDQDVCAEAVVDAEFLKDEGYALPLAAEMMAGETYRGIETERALEILTNLTLEEAITFVNIKEQ